MPNNLPYLQVLREIDKLREQGVADSDPEMMKLRIQLRDHLENLNKNKPKAVVPTLMSIRTVKFEPKPKKKPTILAKSVIHPRVSEKKKIIDLRDIPDVKLAGLDEAKKEHLAKYALLGAIIAVAALAYRWYREKY
jgi:hypothetical protein